MGKKTSSNNHPRKNTNKKATLYGKGNISIKSIPPKKNCGYHGPRDKNSPEYKSYVVSRFNQHFTRHQHSNFPQRQ